MVKLVQDGNRQRSMTPCETTHFRSSQVLMKAAFDDKTNNNNEDENKRSDVFTTLWSSLAIIWCGSTPARFMKAKQSQTDAELCRSQNCNTTTAQECLSCCNCIAQSVRLFSEIGRYIWVTVTAEAKLMFGSDVCLNFRHCEHQSFGELQ